MSHGQGDRYAIGPTGPTGATGAAGADGFSAPQGRLTLTTATPIMSTSTVGTTIYYTPYVGDKIPTYNGSSTWTMRTFTEEALILHATPHLIDTNYDLYMVWDGTELVLCTGTAWTNGTTRATGLTMQNGIWLNTSAQPMKKSSNGDVVAAAGNVPALTATYVGTVRMSAAATTRMDFAIAAVANGNFPKLFLWNAYNRVKAYAIERDGAGNHAYTAEAWRLHSNNTNCRLHFVVGQTTGFEATYYQFAYNPTAGAWMRIGIAYDSDKVRDVDGTTGGCYSTASMVGHMVAALNKYATAGYHYIAPLVAGTATGTSYYYGIESDATKWQTGLHIALDM